MVAVGILGILGGLMVWLAGSILGVGLFYLWLIGHWFARVLVFVSVAGVGLMIWLVSAYKVPGFGYLVGFGYFVGFALVGWVIASIPIWVHRCRSHAILVVPPSRPSL